MIAVDSNVILNVLRKNDPIEQQNESIRFFEHIQNSGTRIALSAISVTEVLRLPFRANSVEQQKTVHDFLRAISAVVIPIERNAAIAAASLIEEKKMQFADALIAASVLQAGIKIFVTRNTSDFKRSGLEICTPEEYMKKYGQN